MDCPFCRHQDTQVKDSRPCEDGAAIRRRRQCASCEARFTTFERVQLRELMVVKRNNKRSPFDRDKLERSMSIALRKRNIDPDMVQQRINNIVRRLESQGDGETNTQDIGRLVMEELSQIDKVAYIRYASVYRNFREAKDFGDFVKDELD
ncbi:MAG: transcriptional repressor NrdR [Alphaproteobacteria bacterium]|jgi:transcriptional repressor NrdR|nr:transcriptional repressor NrdR [Alphaproteobacteria bacterium]MDA8676105.1 transcriptional regulator NrdR [Alphaproteobacteria bacterium]MDG2466425.1 transcriptional regulator NrdR [Alphaproteobacteria bacterium]